MRQRTGQRERHGQTSLRIKGLVLWSRFCFIPVVMVTVAVGVPVLVAVTVVVAAASGTQWFPRCFIVMDGGPGHLWFPAVRFGLRF